MEYKTCSKCKQEKPATADYYNKRGDGLRVECRECQKEYNSRWLEANRGKNKISCQQYQAANRDKLQQYRKHYYEANKEKIKDYHINYHKANKEKIKDYHKQWREANPEKCQILKKEYYNANRKNLIKYTKQWRAANPNRRAEQEHFRRKSDAGYRILCNLKYRISAALKNTGRAESIKKIIGCTKDELKQHLESQFKDGMTWNNYGLYGWHVDHIIPCSAFDLTDPEQQKECFNYNNLQPLWAEENLRKNDKILGG